MKSIGTPLFFEPFVVEKPWGGNRIARRFARPYDHRAPIGESWEIADRMGEQTRVKEGVHCGQRLRDLRREFPHAILGAELHRRGAPWFPLLIKYVDAADRLSVQVHPSDDGAHALHCNDRGKAECWVVIEAEPGGWIYRGLKPGITPSHLRKALDDGGVEDLLIRFEVRRGDLIAIPPGMIHALGSGVLIAEIQQNSDVTFRLYDYDQVDRKTGRPRALHKEESMKTVVFDGHFGRFFKGDLRRHVVCNLHRDLFGREPGKTPSGVVRGLALEGAHFNLLAGQVAAGDEMRLGPIHGFPTVVMFIEGRGHLGERPVRAGETVLLPAGLPPLALRGQGGEPLVWLEAVPTPDA